MLKTKPLDWKPLVRELDRPSGENPIWMKEASIELRPGRLWQSMMPKWMESDTGPDQTHFSNDNPA